MSWYALTCEPGREEWVKDSCKRHLPAPALEDAFLFSYERMKKYLGQWHADTCRMFPGYVFLQSSCPELLPEAVVHLQRMSFISGRGMQLIPVEEGTKKQIRALCGERRHMALSRGNVRDGRFFAVSGPLVGRENLIARVDLHKRVAVLNLRLAESGLPAWAGIDIG